MPAGKSNASTLSENTWVNLGSVCAILGAVIMFVLYLTAIKADGSTNSLRQDRSEKRLDSVEDKMDIVNDRTARMEEMMKYLVGESRRNKRQ